MVETTDCHMEQEEYTVTHEAVTTYGEWHDTHDCDKRQSDICREVGSGWSKHKEHRSKGVTPAWDETLYREVEVCEDGEEEVCEKVGDTSCSTHSTFTEDKRCHGLTPTAPQWVKYDPYTQELLWSAIGGDKVELHFGWDKTYPYKVTLTNDGHEKVGLGTEIGYWTNIFKMRVLNGCKKGPWLE